MKVANIISALIFSLFFTGAVEAQTNVINGLVDYNTFSGNIVDSSSNNMPILGYFTELTQDRLGFGNSALHLYGWSGGAGESVLEVLNTNNILSMSNELSVCLWFQINDATAFYQQMSLFGTYPLGQGFGLKLADTNSGKYTYTPDFYYYTTNGRVDLTANPILTTNGKPSSNLLSWNHISCTFSNGVSCIYINGNLQATTNVGFTLQNAATTIFCVGGYGEQDSYTYPGLNSCPGNFDEVRVYNRAITAAEVQSIYQFETPAVVNLGRSFYLHSETLKVGTNYQVQISPDLATWTNYGNPFSATNASWRSTFYFDATNAQMYFRLQQQ